jgi:HK97 family phage portal protein
MTQAWYNQERVREKGSVILNRWLAERQAAKAKASSVRNAIPSSSGYYGSELYEWLVGDGARSVAGPVVNERTAMCVGAVYACVALIAGAIASLPVVAYERKSNGKERVDTSRDNLAANLWWLLNEQPHPKYSAAVFWEYLTWALLTGGDSLAWIKRRSPLSPEITGFQPVHPLLCTVVDNPNDPQRLVYLVHEPEQGKVTAVDQDDMIHVPGLGFDGRRGMNPVRYAGKGSIGIALAADEYQGRFFSNGARPDFALSTEKSMNEEQVRILRDSWMQRYGGLPNSHLPAILTGGLKVERLSLSGADIQIIETRKFQVIDICRIYGVPPFMVGETTVTSSWGSGVEAMGAGFVKYTLQRHLTKFEQELNRKLFPRTTRFFLEFQVEGLLRGDSGTRANYYRTALGGGAGPGWMMPNEVRRAENLPPVEGGDKLIGWEEQRSGKDRRGAGKDEGKGKQGN